MPDDRAVWRIDLKTGHKRRIGLRYFPWGVAVADEGIWVSLRRPRRLTLRRGYFARFGFRTRWRLPAPFRTACRAAKVEGVLFASSLSRRHRAAVEVGMLALRPLRPPKVNGTAETRISQSHAITPPTSSRSNARFTSSASERCRVVARRPVTFRALLGLAYVALHFGATALAIPLGSTANAGTRPRSSGQR